MWYMGLILFFFGFTVTACAIPHNIQPRIVGGEEAEEGEFPFQISLQYLGNHICGGTLINLSTILTSASCAELGSVYNFDAVAGKLRLSSNDTNSQSRKLSRGIISPGYPGSSGYTNDIAIMKILTPFEESDYVRPIEIFRGGNYSGIPTVTGFGALHEGGAYSDVLMKVNVPIISDIECRVSYGNIIEDSMICAGLPGKDACTGDNGSPLTMQNISRVTYLVGVSSWGIGCGRKGYPGVYTEISYFEDFIDTNL